jgi:tetratricopeptide (TPR) repeat protein
MKTLWFGAATLCLFIVTPATAATTREIYNIAKATSLKITSQNGGVSSQGSGFLVKKQGNIYSVVTSKHVTKCLAANCKYTLTASDGQSYTVTGEKIKTAADLDLAIIQFSSARNYPIAPLATNQPRSNDIAYTSGFPVANPGFRFAGGNILANAQRRLVGDKGGYTTIYNTYTNSGMSGGAVFNQQGQVIAVHGHGDRITVGTSWVNPSSRFSKEIKAKTQENIGQKAGFNRGIAVTWLRSSELGASLWGNRSSATKPENAQSADDFFILGINKYVNPDQQNIKQEKQQAVEYFNRAIQLKPDYGYAHLIRTFTQFQLNDRTVNWAKTAKYYTLISPYVGDFIADKQLDSWLTNKQNYALATQLYNQAISQVGSFQTGRPVANSQSAIQLYDRAISLFPKDSDNFIKYALLSRKVKETRPAVWQITAKH